MCGNWWSDDYGADWSYPYRSLINIEMTIYILCPKCGEHELPTEEAEACRFCLPGEEDQVEEVDVVTKMRRSVGRRICEGFEMMRD